MNFNPHSREGSDLKTLGSGMRKRNFNPHSREGSDDWEYVRNKDIYISIHTPAKGVTKYGSYYQTNLSISIHTPAKGVTMVGLTKEVGFIFQSTLPRRE